MLLAAAYLGRRPSTLWLALLAAGIGACCAVWRCRCWACPRSSLASLVVPLEIGTGTEVKLNLAALLIPALAVVWLLDMVRRRACAVSRRSRANLPLLLFLAASLLSLLIGRATWDPTVPVGGNFLLVQLAPVGHLRLFGAGLLAGGQSDQETRRWLWRLTALFLLVGGGLAILRLLPGAGRARGPVHHHRLHPRALLGAAGRAGRRATAVQPEPCRCPGAPSWWRCCGASLVYAFVQQQEAASNWVGLAAALGMLVWLRFPRLRWPIVVACSSSCSRWACWFPASIEFAGGDAEWTAAAARGSC